MVLFWAHHPTPFPNLPALLSSRICPEHAEKSAKQITVIKTKFFILNIFIIVNIKRDYI
jgi:hypothetical protein